MSCDAAPPHGSLTHAGVISALFCWVLLSCALFHGAGATPPETVRLSYADIPPGFLQDLANASDLSELHCGESQEGVTALMHFDWLTDEPWWLGLTVSPSIEQSKKAFAKVECPAAPNPLPYTFGDERKIWASAAKWGGTVAIRRGVVTIQVSGQLGFYQLLATASLIDDKAAHSSAGIIRKEISALTAIAKAKDAARNPPPKPSPDPAAKAKQVAQLIAELTGDKVEGRPGVIAQLEALGDRSAVPAIIGNLDPKFDPATRGRAARALGVFHDKRAIEPLTAILGKPITGKDLQDGGSDEILRRTAVISLDWIGDPSSLPLLERIASSDNEYAGVKEVAARAVGRLKGERSEQEGD